MRPPGPADVFRLIALSPRLIAQSQEAVTTALATVPRLSQLVDELTALVAQTRAFLVDAQVTQQEAQELVVAVAATRQQAQDVADRSSVTEAAAASAVTQATTLIDQVQALMTRFEPSLGKLAPIADVVANDISPAHAQALTGMLQSAPDLVEALASDVVPVLGSLETVGADLREVMDNTQQLDEMLGAVPGLGRVKKRVAKDQRIAEERAAREGEQAALTQPPAPLDPVSAAEAAAPDS